MIAACVEMRLSIVRFVDNQKSPYRKFWAMGVTGWGLRIEDRLFVIPGFAKREPQIAIAHRGIPRLLRRDSGFVLAHAPE